MHSCPNYQFGFISLPAPEEDLQRVSPKSFPSLSLVAFQQTSNQRGYAVSESRIVSPHYQLCLISIPAPKQNLQ